MSGRSQSELVRHWADEAAAMAARGEVCEENLRAILGSGFNPALAWRHAHSSYKLMLERLKQSHSPLVLKLIVPLTPRIGLDVVPPETTHIENDVDTTTPPSLVVHRPVFARDWEPVEEYRRPFPADVFVDEDGETLAEGLYIAFRSSWEIEDDSPYRRQLLFERVQV